MCGEQRSIDRTRWADEAKYGPPVAVTGGAGGRRPTAGSRPERQATLDPAAGAERRLRARNRGILFGGGGAATMLRRAIGA